MRLEHKLLGILCDLLRLRPLCTNHSLDGLRNQFFFPQENIHVNRINMRIAENSFMNSAGLIEFSNYLFESYIKKFHFRHLITYGKFYLLGTPDQLKLPPPYYIWLVIGSTDPELFLNSGNFQFNKLIIPLLKRNNLDITECKAILDFGCGCGRLTRWLSPYTQIEV
jgi:2-polyprenyl-3-methyl-5-hydroxy-6-metoxy-1,4-benzoquinol methylase